MACYRTGWPGWPLYGYGACGLSPHHVVPCFYNVAVEKPRPRKKRKFLLDRSIFDLVDDHKFLSLTDPKLLGWFLCLSPGDRKIILDDGGFHHFLQRHPALELSRHNVYVKCNVPSVVPARPAVTSNRPACAPRSTRSGAAESRSEMPGAHLDSERLPPNARETSNLLGCSDGRDGAQNHPSAFDSSTAAQAPDQQQASSHLKEQRPSWSTSSSGGGGAAVWKDSAALTSFSLDVDLERHRWGGGPPGLRSQRADCSDAEGSLLQSDWPTIAKDSSPEYYSFDSIQMDGTEYGSPLDPEEESGPGEGLRDHRVSGNEPTDGDDGDQSELFHSVAERDGSTLFSLSSDDVEALDNGVQSGPVRADGGALAADRETSKSAGDGGAPQPPRVTTRDVTVGSDAAPCQSAVTQTEDPETADKAVITEVHMADLDYLAEEFAKLKMVQEKLGGQKEEMKSSGVTLREECECSRRAQRAELRLLALQYSECRQHCWRLHCVSSEGGRLPPTPEDASANVASVLQQLDSDYNRMRDEILAGVPLEQLRPLSVDSGKIAARASYTPAKIISEVLGNVPSRSSQEPQNPKAPGGERDRANDQSTNGSQNEEHENQMKMETGGRARRAVALVPQGRDASHDAHGPQGKPTTAACRELGACETWYDAEEDLRSAGPPGPPGPAAPAAAGPTGPTGPAAAVDDVTGQEPTGIVKESSSEEVKSSVLCVSNLPSDVTESDVLLWFENHRPSEVIVSALKNDLRVAIVTVSGPQSAEAAVSELHGRCMRGRALHVEHVNGAAGGSPRRASAKDSTQTQTTTTDRKLTSQPPLSSGVRTRKVVCISPTAKGTCVPQRYGTMGSFDTLMAELTQRHPDVGGQRIVDALTELKAERGGVLSGLPLRTIREMTSQLLTRPARTTKL